MDGCAIDKTGAARGFGAVVDVGAMSLAMRPSVLTPVAARNGLRNGRAFAHAGFIIPAIIPEVPGTTRSGLLTKGFLGTLANPGPERSSGDSTRGTFLVKFNASMVSSSFSSSLFSLRFLCCVSSSEVLFLEDRSWAWS